MMRSTRRASLLDRFSTATLDKGHALLDDPDRVRRDVDYPQVWWVTGNDPAPYRVQVAPAFVTCTCLHGLNAGARPTCYHVAAVLLALDADAPDAADAAEHTASAADVTDDHDHDECVAEHEGEAGTS
jgi:uncharacterized Zn finger protein